jgi:ferrochelatase
MRYLNTPHYPHQQRAKIGILICNLGTPTAPNAKALKPYLKQFLSDPRVVEIPRILWWVILNAVILRIRPKRSARSYGKIWTEQGSPLMTHTQAQAEKLATALAAKYPEDLCCTYAMRYGEPSISNAVQTLTEQGARKLMVIPLYPQYSAATNASTFDALAADFTKRRWLPDLRFVSHYHDYPPYIDALAKSVEAHWRIHGRAEKLLFSYHGTPQRYLDNGDPYHCECHKTSRLLAEKLGLEKQQYVTCFQSRFGREPWLQPYADQTLEELAAQGIRSVQVICPGFSADCLETLEEIDQQNRELFLESGGERFEYIPALNSEPDHIAMLQQLVEDNLGGWLPLDQAPEQTLARAKAMGATH